MANETGDLLMMVLKGPGQPVAGESSSNTNMSNSLMRGFKPKSMFEITGFTFGVATLKDTKGEQSKHNSAMAAFMSQISQHLPEHLRIPPELGALEKGVQAVNSPVGEAKSCPVQEITFNRPIDRGSNVLMQYCIDCKTLHGAVVVKLKPAGGKSAGEAYLRLEFINVLFTEMTWSNGEPVEERCTFITRAVNVSYKPQLPDGSLGAEISGFWSRLPSMGERLIC